MKIVVWKSPKALRGILRMLFHIGKPEKEAYHAASARRAGCIRMCEKIFQPGGQGVLPLIPRPQAGNYSNSFFRRRVRRKK
ncbi:MAG: hypothetical protein IJT94_18110, partial [Oscillibacter sp.]|nr:hypothetical protein [Oscillibacter sp.]